MFTFDCLLDSRCFLMFFNSILMGIVQWRCSLNKITKRFSKRQENKCSLLYSRSRLVQMITHLIKARPKVVQFVVQFISLNLIKLIN